MRKVKGREIRPTVGSPTSNTGCRGAKMEAKTQVDGRGDGGADTAEVQNTFWRQS